MNDELGRIERLYGSVPEYYRCMEEETQRKYEKECRDALYYATNREKVRRYKEEGRIAIAEAFCHIEECLSCKTRTETFTYDKEDDIGTFFCLNKGCKHYEKLMESQ